MFSITLGGGVPSDVMENSITFFFFEPFPNTKFMEQSSLQYGSLVVL